MDSWNKTKIIIAGFATILVPVALGFIAQGFSSAIKNREIEGRFVEIAVSILSQKPSKEQRNIRVWAARIIDKYSGVKLGDAEADLIESISLSDEEEQLSYYQAILNLEEAIIDVISLLEARSVIFDTNKKELRIIRVYLTDLKAQLAKVRAHLISVNSGMRQLKAPTASELDRIKVLAGEADRMVASNSEKVLDIAKRVLVLLDELEFIK